MKKKSYASRLGVLAVALTMVTTSLMGGTLAKYTTEVKAEDTAVVAKWKFNETTVTELGGLFDHGMTNVKKDGDTAFLAPGTSGSKTFTIKGESDVNYTLNVEATCAYVGNWYGSESNDKYYPIKFTLEKTGEEQALITDGTLDELKEKLVNLYKTDSGDRVLEPGNREDAYTISWHWDYDTESKDGANDSKDTYLAQMAVTAMEKDRPNVSISLIITATQLTPETNAPTT